MAKRQRTRPGQRPAAIRGQRPAARPSAARPSPARPADRPIAGTLTAAEEARAAEIEADIVARERAADAARTRVPDRRSDVGRLAGSRTRDGSLLAARAEAEYAYVARDVRRIVRVGGSLVGIMAVLFLLIDVFGVIRL